MAKHQVPVMGGLRKVIQTTGVGTTIAEFGSQTVTLDQLKTALGITTSSSSSAASGAPTAALAVGPGLSGGGPVVGTVAVNLIAPPSAYFDDPPMEEPMMMPGPTGPAGVQGVPGPSGWPFAEEVTEELVFLIAKL